MLALKTNFASKLFPFFKGAPSSFDSTHKLNFPFQIFELEFGTSHIVAAGSAVSAGSADSAFSTVSYKCELLQLVLAKEFKEYPFILILSDIDFETVELLQGKYLAGLPFTIVFKKMSNVCILHHVALLDAMTEVNLDDISFKIFGKSMHILRPKAVSKFKSSQIFDWIEVEGNNDKWMVMYDHDLVFLTNLCPHEECRSTNQQMIIRRMGTYYDLKIPAEYHPYSKLVEFIGFCLVIEITDKQVEDLKQIEIFEKQKDGGVKRLRLFEELEEKNLLRKLPPSDSLEGKLLASNSPAGKLSESALSEEKLLASNLLEDF